MYILLQLCPDKEWYWYRIVETMNIPVELFKEKCPDMCISWLKKANWQTIKENIHLVKSWTTLSKHPSITVDIVKNHPYFYWDWETLSQHIDIKEIITDPSLPWEWFFVTERASIYTYRKYPHLPWKYTVLSGKRELTLKDVLAVPTEGWTWYRIYNHKNITWEEVRTYLLEGIHKDMYLCDIERTDIPLDMVEKYSHRIRWDRFSYNSNSNLTEEFIEKYKEKLNFSSIISYNNFPLDFLRKYHDRIHDWRTLSYNYSLDIISETINEFPWVMYTLCQRPDMRWNFMEKHILKMFPENYLKEPYVPFDELKMYAETTANLMLIRKISKNKNMPLDFIKNHPDIKWCWESVSGREDITWKFVYENPNLPWSWSAISHTLLSNIDKYERKQAGLLILKNYILYKKRIRRKEICEEISLLPGGKIYKQAKKEFQSLCL